MMLSIRAYQKIYPKCDIFLNFSHGNYYFFYPFARYRAVDKFPAAIEPTAIYINAANELRWVFDEGRRLSGRGNIFLFLPGRSAPNQISRTAAPTR